MKKSSTPKKASNDKQSKSGANNSVSQNDSQSGQNKSAMTLKK